MNKIKLSFALAAAIALPVAIHAQPTNPPPSGLVDLGNTIIGYFTSFNPALDPTFGANRFDLWTGVSALQGGPVPLANELGLSYDIWKGTPSTNSATLPALSLENVLRDGGIAGTLISEQFGLGASVVIHDVKLTAYLDAVYDLDGTGKSTSDRLDCEVGIRAKKSIGLHFYTGVGLGARCIHSGRVFSAFAGATF